MTHDNCVDLFLCKNFAPLHNEVGYCFMLYVVMSAVYYIIMIVLIRETRWCVAASLGYDDGEGNDYHMSQNGSFFCCS